MQERSYSEPIIVETALSRTHYIILYNFLLFYSISFVPIVILYIGVYKFLPPTGFSNLLLIGVFVGYVSYLVITTLYHAFSPKNRMLFLPTRFTFDEDKVLAEAEGSTTTIQWDAFVWWRALIGRYVLFLSFRKIIVIPQSKIPTQAGSAFEWLLHEKVRKKLLMIGW